LIKLCSLIALAPYLSAVKPFASKVLFPRDQAANAKALAAPVLSYAPMFLRMGRWRRGWRRRRFAIV